MATLSVLKFNDPDGADRVLIALQGMQEREMITLQDAAVVSWPQGNKKPSTRQLHSTAGAGALGGAFWGFLFGLIFFVPFLGAAIGAGMGGALGFVGRRRDQRRLHQAGAREGDGGHLRVVRPDQRRLGTRQGHRRAQAVRLRDHLDQPARGAGEAAARSLRARVVGSKIAVGRPPHSEKRHQRRDGNLRSEGLRNERAGR